MLIEMSLQVGMVLGRKDWGPRALLEAPFSADPCCRWELCVGLIEKRAAARGNFQNKEITTSWSTEIFKSPRAHGLFRAALQSIWLWEGLD